MVCSCQSSRQILMITLILQVSVLMNGLGMRRLVGRFTCGLNSSHNYSEILATSRALKHPCTLLKINLNLSGCQVCKWLPGVQVAASCATEVFSTTCAEDWEWLHSSVVSSSCWVGGKKGEAQGSIPTPFSCDSPCCSHFRGLAV